MKHLIVLALILVLSTHNISAQSVGIGTTSPNSSSLLDLSSDSLGFLTPRMTTPDRLGISGPANGLLVYDTDLFSFMYFDGFAWVQIAIGGGGPPIGNDRIEDIDFNTGVYVDQFLANDDTIRFYSLGIEYLKIDPTGHIHITNTGGSVYLGENAGAADLGGFTLQDIGIGTAALESNDTGEGLVAVGDSALSKNNLGFFNIAIGKSTLKNNTSGNNNTAIGTAALYTNTVGENNVAVGYESTGSNETGLGNSALGNQSLRHNVTGSFNTAIGEGSLLFNESGHSNVAVGTQSLLLNVNKSNLVAVGDSALYNNGFEAESPEHGSHNTAIGSKSMYSNTIGFQNTSLGYQTMYSNIFGSGNVAIGDSTMHANTYGNENTGVGRHSLKSNTEGSENTALGLNSLGNNTEGDFNTATGTNALYKNTTASSNTANGAYSLYSNTTGEDNTAVGNNGLRLNTTGKHNTAMGSDALSSNTTAHANTAVGYEALIYNETGSSNTAIGNVSLNTNTTGSNNVAVGDSSLFSNNTGDNNIGIGKAALFSNTAGNQNISIGDSSLFSMTSGSKGIAIGQQALYFNTDGASNIAIGTKSLYNNTTVSGLVAIGDSSLHKNGLGASGTDEAARNVAVGERALKENTTGYANTAIGHVSLSSNTDGFQNTAVGDSTLYANTSGEENTAMGVSSMRSNTDGLFNTAFGTRTLYANTGFSGNTAVGYEALKSNDNHFNTAMGYWSMKSNIQGEDNVAVGGLSLLNNTIGNHNVAIGTSAMRHNLGGNYNTAIGDSTMSQSFSGSANTAIGRQAMSKNSTGHHNTAIGHHAMKSNNMGFNNVSIGDSSMVKLTIGEDNVAIGRKAGEVETSGFQNVFIGAEAGFSETGSGNIYIGYKSGSALLPSSNNLVIDNQPSATPLIYGDMSADSLVVNGSLDVSKRLKLGDGVKPPRSGEMRWNDTTLDFEGYNGHDWVSLTKQTREWGTSDVFDHTRTLASNGDNYDNFGNSVSISGEWAVIGAPGNYTQSLITGHDNYAYFYKKKGDRFAEKQIVSNQDNRYTGRSVSMDGNYAAIASLIKINGDYELGVFMYLLVGDTWVIQDTVISSASAHTFGNSVCLSGDYMIVGDRYLEVSGEQLYGEAYIYKRNGTDWLLEATLSASDGNEFDYYGNSVYIDGDYAVVGAPGVTDSTGQVYIYKRSGTSWGSEVILTGSDSSNDDEFGFSVAINGDYIAVGAPGKDIGTELQAGKVYIYKKSGSTWGTEKILSLEDPIQYDAYGYSVALLNNELVVGVPYRFYGGYNANGMAIVYKRNGLDWNKYTRLIPSQDAQQTAGNGFEALGTSVAISEKYLIAGGPGWRSNFSAGVYARGAIYFLYK